jgi:hypothetical protein
MPTISIKRIGSDRSDRACRIEQPDGGVHPFVVRIRQRIRRKGVLGAGAGLNSNAGSYIVGRQAGWASGQTPMLGRSPSAGLTGDIRKVSP